MMINEKELGEKGDKTIYLAYFYNHAKFKKYKKALKLF